MLAQAGFDEPNAAGGTGGLSLYVREGEGVLLGWRPRGMVRAFTRVHGHEDGLERRMALPGLHQALDSALSAILEAAGFRTRVVEPGWLLVAGLDRSAAEHKAGEAPSQPTSRSLQVSQSEGR